MRLQVSSSTIVYPNEAQSRLNSSVGGIRTAVERADVVLAHLRESVSSDESLDYDKRRQAYKLKIAALEDQVDRLQEQKESLQVARSANLRDVEILDGLEIELSRIRDNDAPSPIEDDCCGSTTCHFGSRSLASELERANQLCLTDKIHEISS